ncbi:MULTISPECIES: putative holin [Pseudomonas]|uniref:putative holin n=1 Tax=Pseudomonas TaxID=286 RepID=UPI0011844C94|nr:MULTISPECIES: putative holin [unclassified Pseudomonas]QDR69241.1 hypothetical protein FPB55_17200 [Pseudomonas sp. BJP69]
MSADGISSAIIVGAATGAGVVSATQIPIDHVIIMGAIGGCCAFLASTAELKWGSKILYAVFSFIAGYLAGLGILILYPYNVVAAGVALVISALASTMFGSLKAWSEGGKKPAWVEFFERFIPSGLLRGKRDEG